MSKEQVVLLMATQQITQTGGVHAASLLWELQLDFVIQMSLLLACSGWSVTGQQQATVA